MRFWTLLAVVFTIAFLAPQTVQAQDCNERCAQVLNEDGKHEGFACLVGTTSRNCQATVTQCGRIECQVQTRLISDETGAVFASADVCDESEKVVAINFTLWVGGVQFTKRADEALAVAAAGYAQLELRE